MANERVTDLDRFSLEHVWRPYQTKAFPDLVGRLEKPPMNLSGTAAMLSEDGEWSRLVLDRIGRIGFYIPRYVVHPLADIVRKACDDNAEPTP